jgi:hypothetical protein
VVHKSANSYCRRRRRQNGGRAGAGQPLKVSLGYWGCINIVHRAAGYSIRKQQAIRKMIQNLLCAGSAVVGHCAAARRGQAACVQVQAICHYGKGLSPPPRSERSRIVSKVPPLASLRTAVAESSLWSSYRLLQACNI